MLSLHNAPWKTVLLFVFGAYIASVYITRFSRTRRIRKLGGIAPVVPTWLFFGLDFPIISTRALLANKALELWDWMFDVTGGKAHNSYTCELHLLAAERVIFTADVENIKAILTTQFQDYGKGPQFHSEWKDFLGDSIFTTDKQQWHDSRNLIRPMFQRERVADLDLVERHVRKVINLVGPGDGRMVDLKKILFRFSLDASTDFLYGRSTNSLDRESEFATAFDEVQRVQTLESRLGPLRHYHPRNTFYAALKVLDRFIEPFITDALMLSPDELERKLSKSETFIHALARFTRDKKIVRDQIMSLLLAGRDTTASTLSWLFLELSRNPRVVEKLRAEIKDTLGESERPPTYQEIKDMRYLTWTINETLRLYPVVPFNIRTALKDTTLPHGAGPEGLDPVGVLKDTPIGYSAIVMQRRRDLYPPISETFPYDPLDWMPDRWATWTPKAWQFIPFNGGPRICIGMNFAMSEMGYTIVRVLQQFDQIIDYGSKPILKVEIVVTPGDGVNVGFVKSNKTEVKS